MASARNVLKHCRDDVLRFFISFLCTVSHENKTETKQRSTALSLSEDSKRIENTTVLGGVVVRGLASRSPIPGSNLGPGPPLSVV